MKELETLLEDLKNYFAKKAEILREQPNCNAHTEGHLLNRQREIEGFETACKSYDKNPFIKKEIIENFKNKVLEIKSAIDSITIQ